MPGSSPPAAGARRSWSSCAPRWPRRSGSDGVAGDGGRPGGRTVAGGLRTVSTPLRRSAAAPPVRAVHLGLGSFFRAHQAWYTDRAGDGCGIAAFTGRRPDLAQALAAQDGLYTLVTRGAERDTFDVVRSVARAH